MNGISLTSIVRRWWAMLVTVVIVAVAAFAVYRFHGVFGSNDNTSTAGPVGIDVSSSPKRITLEVFGDPGTHATINYLDINVQPQQVINAPLPWSVMMITTQPAAFSNIVAQGNSDSLGCRIIVDDTVKDERVVNTVNAYTYCLVKSA